MKYRDFGKTGKKISVLTFGGGAISGEGKGYAFGQMSEADSEKILKESYAAGINLFDTAPIYGFGLSEKRMGKALKNVREKIYFVSKSGVTWHDNNRVNMTNDPKVAQKMLEQSLRDLDTDYIDFYLVHWPDPNVDIRKTMEVLVKAQDQGKITHIGLSNHFPDEIEKAREVANIEILQNEFNFIKDDIADKIFPYVKKTGMGTMSWGTLGKGVITGTVTKNRKFDEFDSRSYAPWWKDSKENKSIEIMQKLLLELKTRGYSGLELALGHNLSYPELTTLICGVKTTEQLNSMLKALEHLPEKELIDEMKRKYFK